MLLVFGNGYGPEAGSGAVTFLGPKSKLAKATGTSKPCLCCKKQLDYA